MGMSWRKPPPVVAIGGTETFLRDREVRRAVTIAYQERKNVVWASQDEEVMEALTVSRTFGEASLIVVPGDVVSTETIQEAKNTASSCVLVVIDGPLDEKKLPILSEIPGGYQAEHT